MDLRSSRHITYLALSLMFIACTGCATNPITGKKELMFLSEKDDVELGRQYAPQIEKELGGKIEDPILQNYINEVGLRVAKVSQKPYFDYHFAALDHESTNAFALPGGHVYITRGMLEKLESESQLAAILGHETGHIVARDVVNAMSNQIGMSLLVAAAAMSGSSGQVAGAADMARQIIGLKFSRTDEHDADVAGLDYAVRAGYDPYGMVETMQILESLQETRPPEFFSTHPSPENRIGYISERIQTKYAAAADFRKGEQEYREFVLERLNAPRKDQFEVLIALGPRR